MMDVVTRGLVAVRGDAVSSEYTLVSGPTGPLTRRYATTTALALS
ncbi:hypothetical protein GQ627_0FII00002 (plasmid) [Klebsiella pneumoniae]|nr:hypothetical protein GQ627_0FII00002 [Klebsiella pneumoniae]